MKQAIYKISKYMGLFAICRWITRKNIRILGYHGIWLGEGHVGNFLFMSPEKFACRMQKIKDMGYPVLTLDDALRQQSKGEHPDFTTVITIDDGWYGSYLHMLPELERQKFTATMYVTTYYCDKQAPVFNVALQYLFSATKVKTLNTSKLGLPVEKVVDLQESLQKDLVVTLLQQHADQLPSEVERQSLLSLLSESLEINYSAIIENKLFHLASTDQLQNMVSRGIDIQLHTHRHRISLKGDDCTEQELKDNKGELSKIAQKPLEHFCYPSGTYDKTVWPTLEKLHIVSATTTETGLVNNQSHRYALPRILDGEEVSDIEFEAELSGFGELKRKLLSFIGH